MPLSFPPIYLLKSHFHKDTAELHRLEREIGVVWNVHEAKIFIGRVNNKSRAAHELRVLGLQTEELVTERKKEVEVEEVGEDFSLPSRKRRKLDSVSVIGRNGGEAEEDVPKREPKPAAKVSSFNQAQSSLPPPGLETSMTLLGSQDEEDQGDTIKVLKLSWYTDSLAANKILPMAPPYLVYEGIIVPEVASTPEPKPTILPKKTSSLPGTQTNTPATRTPFRPFKHGKLRSPESQSKTRPVHLLHETTSEHEIASNLPPFPEYMRTTYCCQRPTPLHSPNDAFISQLKIIRHARELESNEVNGHGFADKAYSNAIATISAYPYTLTSLAEVTNLPNCGDKIASLWHEWKNSGRIQEVDDIESDERLKGLDLFFGIYGVGETTARKFWDRNGWRDLDDVVENGWSTLSSDQKIGLKYYDELALRIPRSEVKYTGSVVLSYATKIHPGFHMMITGGYRRGKEDSGDMDFVLSHPEEKVTSNFIGKLLDKLQLDGWITHRLTVNTKNSARGQETLAWAGGKRRSRYGFDTLDHAFVVWQDPHFPSSSASSHNLNIHPSSEHSGGKNTNVHRRVDIIISPWKTAGCAVLGWTGGTMFERDLRRYCRKVKGWKFDSSGIRRLGDGQWVDLESRAGERRGEETYRDGMVEGEDELLAEKERRVFDGLALEYRVPGERCTH